MAAFIRNLGSQGEFDLLDGLGPVVMRIAAKAFLGSGVGERMGPDFFTEFRRFSDGIDPVLPGWLPLPHSSGAAGPGTGSGPRSGR